MRLVRITAALLLLILVLAGVGIAMWWGEIHKPLPFEDSNLVYEVRSGASIRSVSRELEGLGVLPSRWLLESWARVQQQTGQLKAGEYALEPGLTVNSLLELLVSGQSLQYRITFPEGLTVAEMVELMHEKNGLEATLQINDLQRGLKQITGLDQSEGWFYPDTYQFVRGDRDVDVLRQAYEKMRQELDKAWLQKQVDVPLSSPYEALILASIVEKETGSPEERPMIAGVFVQRLKKGMRLQTDPTVIYGMGTEFKGNIRKSDLRRDTPYNTYTRSGLPPTPIASPGREALIAAVKPADTDALFFVAKGGGRHHFSTTYEAHRNAVIKYQLNGNAARYQGDK